MLNMHNISNPSVVRSEQQAKREKIPRNQCVAVMSKNVEDQCQLKP